MTLSTHYLINCTIFEKTLLKIKHAFWFFVQHLFETFLILKRTERDMIKNVYRSSCKVPLFLSDFNVTLIFVKYSNIKFHENPSTGSRQREKRTDMTKLIFVYRNVSKAPKNAQDFITV